MDNPSVLDTALAVIEAGEHLGAKVRLEPEMSRAVRLHIEELHLRVAELERLVEGLQEVVARYRADILSRRREP